MKNLRLFGFVTIASIVSGAVFLTACSDDTSVSTDSGVDGGSDSPKSDAPVDIDTGTDAATDAGLKTETFTNLLANALCDTLTRCCYGKAGLDGGTPVDGGTFDRASCVGAYVKSGFEGSLSGFQGAASNAAIDQIAGADCLKKLSALSCDLGGAEFQAARAACFNAIKGKAAAGQPCQNVVDCAQGNFCDSVDAGAGLCAPLKPLAGKCGSFDTGNEDKDFLVSDQACSWRAGGDTNRFCLQGPLDGGPVLPKDQWTCAPARPNGEECSNSLWCGSGICNFVDSKCTSPVGVFPQAYCGTFVTP